MKMKGLDMFVLTLIIVGAVNWGLIGFFGFDLVATIFGGYSTILSRITYALVGLAGLYGISLYSKLDRDEVAYSKFD